MIEPPGHASTNKGPHRLKRPGLTIKTNLLDVAPPDSKSQAAASTNWRRRAAAVSSPGAVPQRRNMSKSKLSLGGSEGPHSAERENLSSDLVHYRRPKEKQAPWELVLSAPPWQLPISPFSAARLGLGEVTAVQFKQVTPMVVKVNGEDVALPNRFLLDVTPIDPDNAPSGITLGELHHLRVPTKLQPVSSDESEDLLAVLKELVTSGRDTPSSGTTAISDAQVFYLQSRPPKSSVSSGSATPCLSAGDKEVQQPRTISASEDEARFQRMLNRLQKDAEPRPPSQKLPDATAALSSSLIDPAIVAMKIKDKTRPPGLGNSGSRRTESASDSIPMESNHIRSAERQNSGDSGYVSNESEHVPTISPANSSLQAGSHQRSEKLSEDQATKGLNPAAAEFKSTQVDGTACFVPKKISRPPLSNIFPNAMSTSGHHPSSIPVLNAARELPHTEAATNRIINNALPRVVPHAFQTVPPSALVNTSRNNILPGPLPTVDSVPRQVLPHMPLPATLSAATIPLAPNLGIYPSSTPVNIPTLTIPATAATTAFNTFPSAPGLTMPTILNLNPCLHPTIPYPSSTTTLPSLPALPGGGGPNLNANSNTNAKPARPYFPVTTKPRDHDPVKQQMYEAYLEWRKANEPGYHMKCKMRQAQRVVRQFQLQSQQQGQQKHNQQEEEREGHHHHHHHQQKPQGKNNDEKNGKNNAAAWKAIAEKAKAAVGAVAAAAAAEERVRKEVVREELRVKVRELSRDLDLGGSGGSGEGEKC